MTIRKRLLLTSVTLVALLAISTGLARTRPPQNSALFDTETGNDGKVVTRENNPNYPLPNPFYFEGKIDYELLGIDTPKNAWEYMQRGIHKQDDLEDFAGAKADYTTSIAMNNLQNGTCQLVTTSPVPAKLNPPPCMFTVRSRLGYLFLEENPEEAIRLFKEVLEIDPLRLEINLLIGEAYLHEAEHTTDATAKHQYLLKAVEAFKAELALSPVTAQSIQLTGDEANNSEAHWLLAEAYEELKDHANELAELQLYLKATKWHSDTYPWRIKVAEHRIKELQH